MKNLLQKKELSDWFILIAVVLSVVGIILYVNTGVTDFNEHLNWACIIGFIVAAVIDLAGFVFSFKALKYIGFIIALYAFVEYVASQITYIVNIFVAIDGSTFTAGFIFTFLGMFLAVGLALASGIMAHHDFDEILPRKTAKEEIK